LKYRNLLPILLPVLAAAAQPDPVLDAMKAELKRSMTLTLNQLEKPYYVSYTVDDEHSWSASATLGGVVSSGTGNYRIPGVRIRVGDYKFDNTDWAGTGGGGARYDLGSFPLEDDPLVIRQYLWLVTDSIFKGSLRSIAGKQSALRNVTVTDQLPDFDKAQPFVSNHDYIPVKIDQDGWTDRTRRVSAVFNDFPQLRTSSVTFTAVDALHRFITNEGTQVREQQTTGMVEVRASAQAPDGMIVRDLDTFYTRDLTHLFPEADLMRSARNVAEQTRKLADAPLGEAYTGPVLFEGVASAQLLAELLGRNLHITRKPVAMPGAPSQTSPTDLEGRRGVRIMPEFFDVTDDPTLPLFGMEEADDEGVPDRKLQLVEKGVLKDFLRTRQPVRGYTDSNGHARVNGSYGAEGAVPTNLVIRAGETSPIAELKQKLIDLIQQRGLPYGMIVRKLDFPSSASADEARRIIAAAGGNGSHPVAMPLYAYRLYVDGHEELVRGQRFRGINARSLKDILAAGNDSVTFNYLENGAPFALLGFGGSSAQVSIVAPSVLIDDLEMVKVDDELPKLPIVASPLVTRNTEKTPAPAQ